MTFPSTEIFQFTCCLLSGAGFALSVGFWSAAGPLFFRRGAHVVDALNVLSAAISLFLICLIINDGLVLFYHITAFTVGFLLFKALFDKYLRRKVFLLTVSALALIPVIKKKFRL